MSDKELYTPIRYQYFPSTQESEFEELVNLLKDLPNDLKDYDEDWYKPVRGLVYYPNAPEFDYWQNITLISDLNSLYIFEIAPKKFYFLGDQHRSKTKGNCEKKLGIKCDDYNNKYTDAEYYGGKCSSIGILLKNWFIYNADHKIKTDFFLELAFTKGNDRKRLLDNNEILDRLRYEEASDKLDQLEDQSWMSLIASIMQPCFIREKRICAYNPYVHAHYADVRSYDDGVNSFEADPFILLDLYKYINKNIPNNIESLIEVKNELLIILSIIIQDYRKILNGIMHPNGFLTFIKEFHNMSSFFSQDFGKLFIKKFDNMKKISVVRDNKIMHRTAGELLRLHKENKYMANLVEDFIYNKAEEYIEEIKIFFDESLVIFDEFDNMNKEEMQYEILNIISGFIGNVVPMSALSMDAYLLARMFLHTESSEIIVYAGSNHIKNYVEFFEYYLDNKQKIGISSVLDNRCLESKDLPKYLEANTHRIYVAKKNLGLNK